LSEAQVLLRFGQEYSYCFKATYVKNWCSVAICRMR